jgi:hypothetical protein
VIGIERTDHQSILPIRGRTGPLQRWRSTTSVPHLSEAHGIGPRNGEVANLIWGVVADGGADRRPYNCCMTTITAEAVSAGRTSGIWKSVATFVAGAVVAGGLATGVSLARDDSSPSVHGTTSTVSVSGPSSDDLGCRVHPHGFC